MYGFPSITQFQGCYPLVNRTTHHRAMLIFPGSGKISHRIGGREGGTRTYLSLYIWIPLGPAILSVPSAYQPHHKSQSYANLSRFRTNQPLHWREGRRHQSTTIFTCTDYPGSHDSSSAIRLSIRPHVTKLG